jgi:hypothetical protein
MMEHVDGALFHVTVAVAGTVIFAGTRAYASAIAGNRLAASSLNGKLEMCQVKPLVSEAAIRV